jgi:hypothetical protein
MSLAGVTAGVGYAVAAGTVVSTTVAAGRMVRCATCGKRVRNLAQHRRNEHRHKSAGHHAPRHQRTRHHNRSRRSAPFSTWGF